MRDLSRNMNEEQLAKHKETFELFQKIIDQKQKDKDKIYALYEPYIYAIAKGKDHKKYEYGTKASIVTTKNSGIIIGVAAHKKNEHDSRTLEAALSSANKHRTKPIKEAICDRGYRGKKKVDGTQISIPGKPLKRDTEYQKEQKRKKFRRRAAIEPIIGHLKSDHRFSRNYLKGFIGDEINLLLAAAAFNFKKWMNHFLVLVCMVKISMILYAISRTRQEERHKYAELYLVLFSLW